MPVVRIHDETDAVPRNVTRHQSALVSENDDNLMHAGSKETIDLEADEGDASPFEQRFGSSHASRLARGGQDCRDAPVHAQSADATGSSAASCSASILPMMRSRCFCSSFMG